MNQVMPYVSFGIPVRNGEKYIERLIESILKQTFEDFEIVVADNASTDETARILRDYSSRDNRIRCYYSKNNIGQIENFNRVFALSRGKMFRWIGADDWLEPTYTESCVSVMDNDPTLIAVTTHTVMHYDNGHVKRFEYEGERLESEQPNGRFARLMWLLSKGLLYLSPLSALFRRDALEKTQLFQIAPDTDLIMVAELSLVGPFGHIGQHLVNRRRPAVRPLDREKMYRRYHPVRHKEVRHSYRKACMIIASMIWNSPLATDQKISCILSLTRFFLSVLPRELMSESKLLVLRLLPKESTLIKALNKAKAKD